MVGVASLGLVRPFRVGADLIRVGVTSSGWVRSS